MVKQFKGEVKISDVQTEFDTLVNRINKMVDAYNGTNQVITNIDYTKGGSNLAPSGYTLTVGGIKQALKSLDGLQNPSRKVSDLNLRHYRRI